MLQIEKERALDHNQANSALDLSARQTLLDTLESTELTVLAILIFLRQNANFFIPVDKHSLIVDTNF